MTPIIFLLALKTNPMKNFKSPKRVKKNNHRCPRLAKIDTSSLGAAHRVTRSSYRLIQNLFIRNWDKWPTRPDPESEECCSRFRDSSLTSVHHQKCFHYNNFLSHVTAFLSLRNRGYKKCFLFKVFQDVMIISCAVKLTQARRTESLEGLLIFSHETLQLLHANK